MCFVAVGPAAVARGGNTWTALAKESVCLFARGEKGIERAAEPRRVLHWRLSLKFCKCNSLFKTEWESRRPSTSVLAPSVGWFTRCEATFGAEHLSWLIQTGRRGVVHTRTLMRLSNERATVIRWCFRWARSVRSALVLVILLGCRLLSQSVFPILQIGKTCLRII